MTGTSGLYGINKTNQRKSVMSKNMFPTFFPVAAALYLNDRGESIHYVRVKDGELALDSIRLADALCLDNDRLHEVTWYKEARPDRFGQSSHGPPVDVVPVLDGKQGLEVEVKLTVVPTFSRSKVTEMVIRQNTQFTFTERLAYCHADLVRAMPVTTDTLRRAIRNSDDEQAPFILHGVWQTMGNTHKLNERNTADMYMISDFAYLQMLLGRKHGRDGTPTRAGRVTARVCSWLTDYFEAGAMAYKLSRRQSVDHLKVNLYPSDHLEDLKTKYYEMRLNIGDMKAIIPKQSLRDMSPERRLDASLAFSLNV